MGCGVSTDSIEPAIYSTEELQEAAQSAGGELEISLRFGRYPPDDFTVTIPPGPAFALIKDESGNKMSWFFAAGSGGWVEWKE